MGTRFRIPERTTIRDENFAVPKSDRPSVGAGRVAGPVSLPALALGRTPQALATSDGLSDYSHKEVVVGALVKRKDSNLVQYFVLRMQ